MAQGVGCKVILSEVGCIRFIGSIGYLVFSRLRCYSFPETNKTNETQGFFRVLLGWLLHEPQKLWYREGRVGYGAKSIRATTVSFASGMPRSS